MTRFLLLLIVCGALCAQDVYAGYVGLWVDVRATAYSPHDECDSHHWSSQDEITAIGRNWLKHPYGVAVPYHDGDALFLSYGTRIIVPHGYGYLDKTFTKPEDRVFMVDDTGGSLRTKMRRWRKPVIDLRYRDSVDAMRFGGRAGHRDVRIFVIEGVYVAPPPEPVLVVDPPRTPEPEPLPMPVASIPAPSLPQEPQHPIGLFIFLILSFVLCGGLCIWRFR